MIFGDKLKSLFKGERKNADAAVSKYTSAISSSKEAVEDMDAFVKKIIEYFTKYEINIRRIISYLGKANNQIESLSSELNLPGKLTQENIDKILKFANAAKSTVSLKIKFDRDEEKYFNDNPIFHDIRELVKKEERELEELRETYNQFNNYNNLKKLNLGTLPNQAYITLIYRAKNEITKLETYLQEYRREASKEMKEFKERKAQLQVLFENIQKAA